MTGRISSTFTAFVSSILLACCVFGQSGVKKEAGWDTFSPPGEDFSVEAPEGMKTEILHGGDARSYRIRIGDSFFFVFSEKTDFDGTIRTAERFIRGFVFVGQPQIFGNTRAVRYEFQDDEGYFHTAVSLVVNGRNVLFHSLSREKDDPFRKRFFQDLTIAGQQAKEVTDNSPFPIPASASITVKNFYAPSKDGNLDKLARSPSDEKPAVTAVAVATSPVKLETIPKAGYTDLARHYNITGSVRLKVVLTADGTVGSIEPVTFLPFGLTKKAIEAARTIRFSPKTVNGTPVTISKILEYSYTLY